MSVAAEQELTGIKLTEDGARPTYKAKPEDVELAVLRSKGRDVEAVRPTTAQDLKNLFNRLSSEEGPFPKRFRDVIDLEIERRKRRK